MLTKLYKLIFDISICYTIGAFLLKYFGGITIFGGSFLILFITAMISILLGQKRRLVILATILIPIVYLIFSLPAIKELVVFLLIWAYYSYVLITERYVLKREEFVDMLKRFLFLFLLLVFPMLTSFHNFSTSILVACPYLIVTMVSAILLLRHLRAVNQMEQMKRYRLQQFMELLAFLAICLLLTLARAPQYLVEGLKQMYQHLLVPILSFLVSILGMLFYGIVYLISKAIRYPTNNKEIKGVKINFGNMISQSKDITDVNGAGTGWVVPLMYSIGAIIIMVLLFIFFRWLIGEKFKQNLPSGILETREYLTDAKDEKSAFRKRQTKDSRATVRYYYGKCLLWLQQKKVPLKPQNTTEEINDNYNILNTNDSEVERVASVQLMKIYRRARYQMSEQITKEEAEKAKQLYQTIKDTKIKK